MSDLMRIYTNVQAMQSMNSLSIINNKIGMHQLRLATGKRINSASEDPAGYQLSKSLETRRRGLEAALQNVSQAKNVLNVAEGGYQNIMDILQTIKEKATQASDYSLSATQRSSIDDQVTALITEIDDIVTETTFNGDSLIDGGYSGAFHTGEGATDELMISLGNGSSTALGIDTVNLSTAGGASAAISTASAAIDTLASRIQAVGQYKVRLGTKERTLSVAVTNAEATRSVIEDADFAKEQMEVLKLQILQQTAVSSLSQANSAPQVVLSLFK